MNFNDITDYPNGLSEEIKQYNTSKRMLEDLTDKFNRIVIISMEKHRHWLETNIESFLGETQIIRDSIEIKEEDHSGFLPAKVLFLILLRSS